ncbi:hypothetical protein NFC81_13190 [Salinispirillum sp. LH 10-3-1]|uniref:Transporter substrate-binding domain-containing protein n=1 Tax=Salinispirillum sp. LH 10-3-1 TaxID=2952525 RepID=A0AB38YES6_9GAMM
MVNWWRANIILSALFCTALGLAQPQSVVLWNYHDLPPFVIDQRSGLSHALADWLNRHAEGQYEFSVLTLPRERLNVLLQQGHQGIVLWANPAWFGDSAEETFLWSEAMLEDRNAVISHRSHSIDYAGPESLRGKHLAVVRGYRFADLEPLIEAGQIVRYDVNREDNALLMVSRLRDVQVTIMSDISAGFIAQKLGVEDDLYLSPVAHSYYERRLLITSQLTDVADFLEEHIPRLLASEEWAQWLDS